MWTASTKNNLCEFHLGEWHKATPEISDTIYLKKGGIKRRRMKSF